jgi:putative thioredoxin
MLGLRPASGPVGGAASPDKSALIKDGSDAAFMADVIEESRNQPVIVDFWATWCGPCRQLTPALEKAVLAAKGAVKLVKIDVDKNPRFAGQLRVQSIPTVYAFKDGQPVDGFMGALPESQIKAFIDKLGKGGGAPGASEVDELLAMATESLAVNDIGGAAQAYAQILQLDPENAKAIAGLARAYLSGGNAERAREILEMAPPDSKDPEIAGVRAALELASGPTGDLAAFQQRLQADPNDHEARFELANGLAGQGRLEEAVDHLLQIVKSDRAWNDEAARKQLIKIFEAAGPTSEVAKAGRRKLSAVLFS